MLVGLLVVGVAGYWGYDQYRERQQLEIYLGNKYQQAFYELVENIEQLQVLLGKSLASTSPDQGVLMLTDVWSRANRAQAELNQLPISAQTATTTAKFLSQTGDYAHVMAQIYARGRSLSAEQREKLRQMRDSAVEVSDSLHDLGTKTFSGKVSWAELIRNSRRQLAKDGNMGSNAVEDGISGISQELTKLPVLIYDGPFSDHIEQAEPKGVKGGVISKNEAEARAEKAADFTASRGVAGSAGEEAAVTAAGAVPAAGQAVKVSGGTSVNGKIAAYNFDVSSDGQGKYSIDISKQGGHLINMLNNRDVQGSSIETSTAVEKARDFLASRGYPGMEPTYSEVRNNVAFISCAYRNKDITYYPDVINVQVALDNGQVIGVSALSYLMSHRERELDKPKMTADEARKLAESTLDSIDSVKLAVIPRSDLSEVLTYEVRGDNQGDTYLIYFNAENGQEEKVFQVIKGEEGTFVL